MKNLAKIAALSGVCIAMLSSAALAEKMGHGGGGQGQRFEKMDTNGDGSLTVDEFVGAATSRFDKADTNSDGVLSKDELVQRMMRKRLEHRAERMIKRMDYNGDGKVTKDEIESRTRKRFALMDGNDDGKVDKSEMKRNSMRMGKGGRRGMRKHRRMGEGHGMGHGGNMGHGQHKRMGEGGQDN